MDHDDLIATFRAIPGVSVIPEPSSLTVHVGNGVPALRIDTAHIIDAEQVAGPAGQAAARITLADPDQPEPRLVAYVTRGDVAFAPDPQRASAELSPGGLSYEVTNLPPGVSYQEMVRDFHAPTRRSSNLDYFHGRVLMLCAFWWGAHRVGLDVDDLRPKLDELIAELRSQ